MFTRFLHGSEFPSHTYLTVHLLPSAIGFANGNAKVNKGTTAQLCAIYAKSSANWRTAIRKSFIPENKLRIVPTKIVDKSNVAEFATQIRDLLKK